jgi:hypothetical protein
MSRYVCTCGAVYRIRSRAVIHITVPHNDGKAHRIPGLR